MSNRYFNQFQLALEKKVESIFAKVSFGATGAPTLSNPNCKGIVSVTRNSAGVYTFVFGSSVAAKDTYYKLLLVKHVFNSGASAPASPGMYIKSDLTNIAASASIQIVFNAAGTATDPASGEIVYLEFQFSDSNSG